MRCVFSHLAKGAEREAWQQFEARASEFWHWVKRHPQAGGAELDRAVRKVDSGLSAEYWPASYRSERAWDGALIVGVERLSRRPLARALAMRAPEAEVGRVLVQRPAMGVAQALDVSAAITRFDTRRARVRVGFSRGHLLNLVFHAPWADSQNDPAAQAGAELLAECLLGEQLLDDWVESISVVPAPRGGSLRVLQASDVSERTVPAAALPETVASGIDAALAETRPLKECVATEGWTLFELEPEDSEAQSAQDDLVIASSFLPEMLKCFLKGASFSSARFAKYGEVFGYLKYQSAHVDFESRLRERCELEDILNQCLLESETGCVVGNGLGLHYCYITLALSELRSSVARVQATCRARGLSRASWILFCDSDFADEWVGVWDDSPPPP